MLKLLGFVIKRWRCEVLTLDGGLVAVVLCGPRGQRYFLPPVIDSQRCPVPKYVLAKLPRAVFPELVPVR